MKHSFEIDEFLNSFRDLITEDIFEALVLRRIRGCWTIIGCNWKPGCSDLCFFTDYNPPLLKVYTLEERYAEEPLYVIINYQNQELDEEQFPASKYMNADMSDVNLISFIESLRYESADNVEQILRPIHRWIESVEFPKEWDCKPESEAPFWDDFLNRQHFKLRLFMESRMSFFRSCFDILKMALGEADVEWIKYLFPTWVQEVCLTRQNKKYHLFLDGEERTVEVWLNNNRAMGIFVDINSVDEESIAKFKEKLEAFLKVTEENA